MKKISKYFLMASVFLTVNVPMAFADTAVCELVKRLGTVINTLRTLAFVGAAFLLMDWAWGYIKDPSKATKDDMKDKGVGMFIGFFILFGVGFLLQFVGSEGGQSYLGCVSKAFSAGLK